jgi:two-component system phosphate regulon sensor histidine kinase PhoR
MHPKARRMSRADFTDCRALIEGLREPTLVAGDDGCVLLANEAARKLLGKHVEGALVADAIAHPAASEWLERGKAGVADEIELTALAGSRRHWLMRMTAIGEGAMLIRLIDRSEAHAAEQMRVDFVANASHELRTPLATLIGYTETLREAADELDAETRERFLSIVDDEAHRMQSVVEDLISLSRIEAERFTTPTAAVALRPLIEQAADQNRRAASKRGSTLEVQIENDLPDVAADPGQILQLLDNLITNALRYGAAGTPVSVSADREGAMVHVQVADHGDGIAPEHIKRVTERFYRVDTSRSRSLGGTGLGLSIVKHIVERHRGRLTIDSEVGKGTVIHVLLPVAGSPPS